MAGRVTGRMRLASTAAVLLVTSFFVPAAAAPREVPTVPVTTESATTDPATTESSTTTPVTTTPVETTPIDTTPVDTSPVATLPIDTTPADTAPIDTGAVESTPPSSAPADTSPVETVESTIAPECITQGSVPEADDAGVTDASIVADDPCAPQDCTPYIEGEDGPLVLPEGCQEISAQRAIAPGAVDNPTLTGSCGIRMMVVVDSSGSIATAGATQTVRNALTAFLTTLNNTGSDVAIVDFATNAVLKIPYTTLNDTTIGTFTN